MIVCNQCRKENAKINTIYGYFCSEHCMNKFLVEMQQNDN